MTESRTLADVFDPRRNSLNALRLMLAMLVIVSHTWPIGGYGEDPGTGPDTSNLGTWAVAGFFGISGYLITASRLHSHTLVDFLWRRILRIYPAFFVVILLVAFVFAPLGALLDSGNSWSVTSAVRFVGQALPLWMHNYSPADSLLTVPTPYLWAGTLWTLPFEFACYLIIGLLVTFVREQRVLLWIVVAWLVGSTAGTLAHQVAGTSATDDLSRLLRLGAFFAAGALLYLLRDRVPVSRWWALTAAAVIVALILTGQFTAFAGIPVAYLMMYLGVALPLHKIGSENDISYGMYIYGEPVQQLLVLIFGARVLPLPLFVVLALMLTVPFAWASWLGVERPALKWKRLTARRSIDREGHVLPSEQSAAQL